MDNFKELVTKLLSLTESVSTDLSHVDPAIRGNIAGKRYTDKMELEALDRKVRMAIPSNSVLIMLKGNVTDSSIDGFADLGLPVIDTQTFYRNVAARSKSLSGEDTFNSFTYNMVVNDMRALSSLTGFKMLIPNLATEFVVASNSLEDAVRNFIRTSSGADVEILFTLIMAHSSIKASKQALSPLPIVVNNLNGATKEQYGVLFTNIVEFDLVSGTEEEVKEKMLELASKIKTNKKQKIEKKVKTKNEEQ